VVLCDPIVNVKGLSKLIDIVRLFTKEIDDPATIGPPTRPGENVP